MTYRDNFYVAQNIYGYTGDVERNPTVYFKSATEHGRITQDHARKENIGRDVVKTTEGYTIGNQYVVKDAEGSRIGNPADGNGEWRCIEYQEDSSEHQVFDKTHTSRSVLVLLSERTAAQLATELPLLSQSIWRHPELKKNRRRNSV